MKEKQEMNPNEIKKALECRVNCNSNECSKCPYRIGEYLCDVVTSAKDTLAYINQLESDFQLLKNDYENLKGCYEDAINHNRQLRVKRMNDCAKMKTAKSDAIKEFAELIIKDICEQVNAPTPSESYIVEKCNQVIVNRLKEMVGDEE